MLQLLITSIKIFYSIISIHIIYFTSALEIADEEKKHCFYYSKNHDNDLDSSNALEIVYNRDAPNAEIQFDTSIIIKIDLLDTVNALLMTSM